MSDSSPIRDAWVRCFLVDDVLAAILIGLVGLAILEESNKSLIFQIILNVDYRLPVSLVVYRKKTVEKTSA